MARSFSWGNSSNDSVLDIFQDCQFTDKPEQRRSENEAGGRQEGERESGPDCTQDHCTNCCTTQVRWQSKAVLGWFACWTTTHGLQSYSMEMEWNNCEYQYWDKWNFSVYFESLYYRYYSKAVNANIWRLYVQSVYKCHLPDLLKRFLGGVRCIMCGLWWCLGDIILTSVCLLLG